MVARETPQKMVTVGLFASGAQSNSGEAYGARGFWGTNDVSSNPMEAHEKIETQEVEKTHRKSQF